MFRRCRYIQALRVSNGKSTIKQSCLWSQSIIPTHNRGKCIERAIASVLAQTYADLEAIVVDDGSEDDTVRVVEAYARKDSRIRLIEHDKRKGAQAARNTGIHAARGEWIAFLDSDDEWLHDSLAQAATSYRRQSPGSAFRVRYHSSGKHRIATIRVPSLQGWVYRQLLQKSGLTFPSLLVSKECLKHIGYLDQTVIAYRNRHTGIRLVKYFQFGFVRVPTFIYDCRFADSCPRTRFGTLKDMNKCLQSTFGPSSASWDQRL